MPPAVEVRELTKRYGDLTALDGVSLSVEHGECVALLGPNGAGKSTLMACVTTLRSPTSGTVRVCGASVDEDPGAVRRSLGVAFQTPATSRHLDAREVLVHHARLHALDAGTAHDRADELLAFVGLADRGDDRVDTFSGGMKRRLDLARVLVTEPDVLVLDEPTAGLDPRGRAEVQERLRALVDEGTTLLLATHDLDEAQHLAERVAILDRGRVLADGAPGRLARDLGRRVVRIEPGEAGRAAVEEVLAELGDHGTVPAGDAVEIVLPEHGGTTPGEVVDALEDAGIPYENATVREPDLGDVFLELTGRRFDDERREGSA